MHDICRRHGTILAGIAFLMTAHIAQSSLTDPDIETRVAALLSRMTLEEKVGQMSQRHAGDGLAARVGEGIRAGKVGSIINLVDPEGFNVLQRIAVEESRLGIPLLAGRDVIHGFRHIMPIPLGQAATWNPDVVRRGARLAALEAAAAGINWTFAPMVDIARDPRWGRVAESLGEDPVLAGRLGAAMVEGFQGDDLSDPGTIAACAKHFAGYGASESGKDYSTTNIPENELRNVYLRPFHATVEAGVATLMASFSDLDGIPATANRFLMREVLRDEWEFDGLVVSDWNSVRQLQDHGLTGSDRESAFEAASAGVDMEMAGDAYLVQLPKLVADGVIDEALIDAAVANILRLKFRMGLFERPYVDSSAVPILPEKDVRELLTLAARQSIVLLKNANGTLPLQRDRRRSIAVIGPLADDGYEQLGTWVFDGDPSLSVTGLEGIRQVAGADVDIRYVRAMETTRSRETQPFDEAVAVASQSDVAVLFLGEESILSGEAHSRADISLPGAQAELVRRIRATGKPVVAVIMAGRPLTLTDIVDDVDAILFAWHPGTMGGLAIAELLFGDASPSGKLPVTFPRMVGQVPIYYSQKNTGRPASRDSMVLIDDIPVRAAQTSLGNTAFHLDAGFEPLFPFGFGLSYAEFGYSNLRLSADEFAVGETLTVRVDVRNRGKVAADEVVQLYVRDLVGNVTRPVRELKGFQRTRVEPGETVTVEFELAADDLAFYGRDNTLITEPGEFRLWVGGDSTAELGAPFRLVAAGS